MQLIIQGKNVEITDRVREYVEKKVGKLDRYLPTIDEARMELSTARARSAGDRQVAQLTVRSRGTILRAEEKTSDIFNSIDAVMDKMYRQIARYKGKRQGRGRAAVQGEALPIELELEEEEAEEPRRIVRTKRFRLVPMDEEEAIEQMELLGHDFFVFFNVSVGEINVLYRRKDGNYGLIQPELA
ncbi:MAG: ribosome-associated translation inhibitor RaiA [Anaerolineae bacterium]|nr:ribosome-associated translation inhibitor RaiA [Anaerolineae bacterium]